MHAPSPLRLTKHHGAGNDFLVLLDADDRRPVTAAEVGALCDRHRGIGADGLLRAVPGRHGAHLAMELRNADGSVAEMSGNGIRCLVQAAVDAGWVSPGDVEVDTAAGRRRVTYRPGPEPGLAFASVGMGVPVLGEPVDAEMLGLGDVPGMAFGAVRAARAVDMGNPHVVVLLAAPLAGESGDAVVRGAGARLERSVPSGANVEFVWAGPGADELTMRVWERGVGETLACGTGTCAAVAATASWGVTGGRVVVHNPGGPLEVELTDDGAVLGGPTATVASIDVDDTLLARMAGGGGRGEEERGQQVAAAR